MFPFGASWVDLEHSTLVSLADCPGGQAGGRAEVDGGAAFAPP
jgi:hypothetical protein